MFKLLFEVSRNPLEIRTAAFRLANMIPDDRTGESQRARALSPKQMSLSMATEVLKLVFFNLSNNNIPDNNQRELRTHDKLLLHLVEAVSSSNPEILSRIYSGDCATTKAVKEAVYGSAIREKHYAIVSRLLESGVCPNTQVRGVRHRECKLERGIVKLQWELLSKRRSGLHEAASACDIRLAKILLDAGASADSACTRDISALDMAAFAGGDASASDDSLKFAQLLVERGALIGGSTSCRGCRHLALISPIAVSVSKRNAPLADYLIELDTSMGSYQYTEDSQWACGLGKWSASPRGLVGTSYKALHIAIVLGNKDMIWRLLQPMLSYSTQAPILDVVKGAFITACLAGDANTVSKLLAYHPSLREIDQRWPEGVTPLVATAWNKDITIAERLLGLDAPVGPRYGDGISRTSAPAPIHVAAYNGNTSLVRRLLSRGADCNVRYTPATSEILGHPRARLLPVVDASPLQLALWSGSGDTAALLISDGKLVRANDMNEDMSICDLAFEGPNVLSVNQTVRMALESTAEIGDKISIIRSYFYLGGLYRSQDLYLAVNAAIESKDCSLVRLLADHRPIREIDSYEASALVISIGKHEWDLVSILLRDPFLPGTSQSYYIELDDGRLKFHEYEDSDRRPYPECYSYELTPLCWAILAATESIVEDMMRRGYKLQEQDMDFLGRDDKRNARAANCVLRSLKSRDLRYRQALLCSSLRSHDTQRIHKYIKLVDTLDFEIDMVCKFVYSPLGLAALLGDVEVVRLLLDAGASTEFRQHPTNATALQFAAYIGHLDVVKYLLSRGATVEPPRRLETGATALQWSARRGDLDMAKILLSNMADINALPAKQYGFTALEGAATYGRLDMVQFLLEMGAGLEGEMRIYYVRSVRFAREEGHYAIADLLKGYGSWGGRDQALYDRPGTLDRCCYYRYDAEISDWHIREILSGAGDDWYSVGSSDTSDDGIEQADNVEDDSDESSDSYYDMDRISRTWCPGIDHIAAKPGGHDFTNERSWGHGSMASSQISTSQRVIELDGTLIDDDVVQIATDNDALNETTANGHTADELAIRRKGSTRIEGEPSFEVDNFTPGMSWTNEHNVLLDPAETEWEGPFSNFSEVDDLNKAFGVLPFRSWG